MKWDEETDSWVLSSGRSFYAFSGYLSIDPEGESDHLCYGSDGGKHVEDWTPDERKEVAEHQIALWRAWATKGRAAD